MTEPPIVLGLVQPLHGVTFALLHLACIRVIVLVVPLRLAATAQSIYGTLCIGLATTLLTLASGVLYERMGGLDLPRHGCTLSAGAANVCRPPFITGTGMLSISLLLEALPCRNERHIYSGVGQFTIGD